MGVLIVAEAPPATSPYNQWRVYRATSKMGSYSLISTQSISDLTYYDTDGTLTHWYKISYYDGTNESALSDPLRVISETYTTVKKVEALLQIGPLSDSTRPTIQQVMELINRVEDEIDTRTGHAWRLRYSGTSSGFETEAEYEYYDIALPCEYQVGIPIYLKHRKIRKFDASEGDAIEFWNGSEWEDWLTTKTEGRGNDWWCDYDRGILYLRAYLFGDKPVGLRVKYRYGDDFVDKTIEDIATKMVVVNILMGEDRSVLLPEGTSNIPVLEKVNIWKQEVEEKLQHFKEFQVMGSVW